MNSELTLEKLMVHDGHNVEIVHYGEQDNIQNYALECLTCYEVLADADADGGN